PPKPPPPPEPDDDGEFPIVPRAAIIPPRFGTAELENSPPPPPPEPANPSPEPGAPPRYQIGIQLDPGATRPSRSSSRLRPSTVAQTTAWSGVSSHGRPASATT